MKKWIRKWLGIDTLDRRVGLQLMRLDSQLERLVAIEADFNSRDTCKVCGKHRYNSPLCLAKTG